MTGALLCPLVIAVLLKGGNTLPMIGIAVLGLIFWLIFLAAKIPERGEDQNGQNGQSSFAFLKSKTFWILTGLVFCQNAAETSVAGWLVTYYKDSQGQGFYNWAIELKELGEPVGSISVVDRSGG